MMAGFTFDGLHNERDVGVTLSSDVQIGNPSKIKTKERLTGTNIDYDFSTISGVQQYNTRLISAELNIIDFDRLDYRSSQLVATRVLNWLMRPNERVKLTIDKFPEYYFMAEVENLDDLETDLFETGTFTVEFTAYPFKVRDRVEGDDEWATFNFVTDVRQVTHVRLPHIENQLPFRELSIGDVVNIGGWAQYFGSTGQVSPYHQSQYYTISNTRQNNDVDFSVGIYDGRQYYLRELDAWVRAQDIVQARFGHTVIQLYNTGLTEVTPEIIYTAFAGNPTYGGITIELDGRFYNLKRGETNRRFNLKTGENILKIYGQGYFLNFAWRHEVI